MTDSSVSCPRGVGALGRSYLATGSSTSLCQVVERKEVSSESSFCSETSGESGTDEENEESDKARRKRKSKERRSNLKESLSDCWNTVKDKVEFAENGDAGGGPSLCALLIAVLSLFLVVATVPFSLYMCVKVVQEYERAVIFRLGRLVKGGAKGPGIFFIIPCIDTYKKVDLRTVSFDVPPQEVLTRDSVTVTVDAVVYYRVSNPTMATNNVEDYGHSTHLLGATTLRNVLGTKCLADILAEREKIANWMETTLDEATDPWGVKVERVEIKDVRLPVQLQRAMAAEAEAAREARAKVITAEGEQKASRALREASNTIAGSSSALQLRYLQTLNSISAEKNSTIIFPVPLDILSHFVRKHKAK